MCYLNVLNYNQTFFENPRSCHLQSSIFNSLPFVFDRFVLKLFNSSYLFLLSVTIRRNINVIIVNILNICTNYCQCNMLQMNLQMTKKNSWHFFNLYRDFFLFNWSIRTYITRRQLNWEFSFSFQNTNQLKI